MTRFKDFNPGIYKIVNDFTGEPRDIYVGSTFSLCERWFNFHLPQLSGARHKNGILQNVWNKYGGKNFSFVVVEQCDLEKSNRRDNPELHEKNENFLQQREQFYIDLWKPRYNISQEAGRPPHDPEVCSRAAKNNWANGVWDMLKTPVIRIHPVTMEQKEYSSIEDAARDNPGINSGTIQRAAAGKMQSAGNFLWRRADGTTPKKEGHDKIFRPLILTKTETGETFRIGSLQECHQRGFSHGVLRWYAEGRRGRKAVEGHVVRFEDERLHMAAEANKYHSKKKKAVVRIDSRSGKTTIYESARAAMADGFEVRQISAVCLGHRKSYGGDRWMFKRDYDLQFHDLKEETQKAFVPGCAKEVIRVNPQTGEEKRYPQQIMVRQDGFNSVMVGKAYRTGAMYKDFLWFDEPGLIKFKAWRAAILESALVR